jgi:hypothetical protein
MEMYQNLAGLIMGERYAVHENILPYAQAEDYPY